MITQKTKKIRQFRKRMTIKHYGYCKDCDEYYDLWKGNTHEEHKWRYALKKELKKLVDGCVEDGCYEEEML